MSVSRLFRLFSFPIAFIRDSILSIARFAWGLIRPDPRRYITDPLDDVLDYIAQFELKYGAEHPVFYRGTYSQALNDAKSELKFLLVYLHGDRHPDTDDFCSAVLSHQEVINYVNRNNLLFWSCSVEKPEGYRVSQALRDNTYPFLALICLKDNRMTVVRKFEGKTTVERVLSQLQQAIEDNEASLITARMDRMERSMNQLLRREQDEAYLESLKADQEKERIKREQQKKKDDEEKMRKEIEENEETKRTQLLSLKTSLLSKIPDEPSDPSDSNVVRLLIKLPNGNRLERRFQRNQSIKYLYYFVFCQEDSPLNFQITTNFPRKALPARAPTVDNMNCLQHPDETEPPTFEDIGLGKSEMLFVHDLES